MKRIIILALVACLIAESATAQTELRPPKFTALEGFCIGFIIGIGIDFSIIVAIRCQRQAPAGTNSPPPLLPPVPAVPMTNEPAGTNSLHSPVLDAGEMAAANFSFRIQSRSLEGSWQDLYRVCSWDTGTGRLTLASSAMGEPLLTNFGGRWQTLKLPLPTNSTLFRIASP